MNLPRANFLRTRAGKQADPAWPFPPLRRKPSRKPCSIGRIAAGVLLGCAALAVAAGVVSAQRGEAIYAGKEPVSGKIRGHDDELPPEAIVCANCHSARPGTQLSATPAPRLDSALLLASIRRRGGPPSAYNQTAFCRLLRTGGDPAYILIAREMPIYTLNDEQCASLWRYLLQARKPE